MGSATSAPRVPLPCHAVAHHRTDGDESEPLLAKLRQPGHEGADRRVVRMADRDGAAVLSGYLLESGELPGDRRGCLVVVEEHVAGRVRDAVGDREANPGTGGRGSRIEKH